MSADRAQKNFDPTPARKQKAKREGNVARSSEVAGSAAFACAALAAFAVVPAIAAAAAHALTVLAAKPDPLRLPAELGAAFGLSVIPACAASAGALAAGVLQAGGLRATAPKFEFARLNPGAGLKRMLGAEALVGALRAVLAFAAVTLALVPIAREIFARSTTLIGAGAFGALAFGAAQRACWAAIGAGACFAVVDYALVRRRWLRDLKMTLEEIRRDQKENDGDPGARARRKTLHRTFVRGSIGRTKEASFVVVNPTHIAIAIRYAPPSIAVPEILVRAADEGAQSVKLIARRHAIPIVENVALARALYAQGEAGRAIPGPTFVAVARVIAALAREGVLT
jgi:flagellar biosynthesis protein FlhB